MAGRSRAIYGTSLYPWPHTQQSSRCLGKCASAISPDRNHISAFRLDAFLKDIGDRISSHSCACSLTKDFVVETVTDYAELFTNI
jgi:hypothetical protein